MKRTPALLSAALSPPSTPKRTVNEILEPKIRSKASLTTKPPTEAPLSSKPARTTAESPTAAGRIKVLVESGGAVLVVEFLLFGVGEGFVGGLGFGEFVFGVGFFVRVRVVLFCEGVVGFFDVGGGGGFGEAEDAVGVFGG